MSPISKTRAALCKRESVQARSYRVNVADEGGSRRGDDAGQRRISAAWTGSSTMPASCATACWSRSRTAPSSGACRWSSGTRSSASISRGVFLCAREAAAQMIGFGNGGVIVNISSISRVGNAGQSNYSAAKAGVESMGVVWAKELARYGIRVGSVAPGFTHTDILASMRPEVLEKLTAPVPLKRLGQRRGNRPRGTASYSRTTSSRAAASRSTAACASELACAEPEDRADPPLARGHARNRSRQQVIGGAVGCGTPRRSRCCGCGRPSAPSPAPRRLRPRTQR